MSAASAEISWSAGISPRIIGKGSKVAFPLRQDNAPRRKNAGVKPEVIPEAVVRIAPFSTTPLPVAHEVLENLYRVGVQSPEAKAGIRLVDAVRKDSHIQTVAFMGPPGAGKTTVIEQFVEALFLRAQGEISVKITSFDPAFQRMIKYLPREFWENVHWKFINDSLILTSKTKERKMRARRKLGPAREIEIIEVPFIGSKATSDRGRSFVERRWQEAQERDEGASMLFVPFVPVASVTRRTASFREEINRASGMVEQVAVLAKYGIEISVDLVRNAGKRAKEIIQEVIQQVLQSASKKQLEVVVLDMRKELREELPNLPPRFLEEFILLPQGVHFSPDEAYNIRRHTFFWEKEFDEMGIPSMQRYIMCNPPMRTVRRSPIQMAA